MLLSTLRCMLEAHVCPSLSLAADYLFTMVTKTTAPRVHPMRALKQTLARLLQGKLL